MHTWDNASSCETQIVAILCPMSLLPNAINDFHAFCNVSLMGLSPVTPGVKQTHHDIFAEVV